jgi:hypothetical protein
LNSATSHRWTSIDYPSVIQNKVKVLGEGEVQSAFESSPEDLLDLLRFYGGAGVFANKYFTIIVYPANVEAWQFMKHSSLSNVGQLRWVAFTPHEPNDDCKLAWRSTDLPDIAVKHVYKQLFKIQYAELIPPAPANLPPSKEPPHVHIFIMADTSCAWNETLILYKILKLSGATIFWSGQEGAWDYFSQHVNYGILLVSDLSPILQLRMSYLPSCAQCRVGRIAINTGPFQTQAGAQQFPASRCCPYP